MGGSAFNASLKPEAFPRLPPAVYKAVKARLKPILESFYTHVGVPAEAPEKPSHGDIDFVVACAKACACITESELRSDKLTIPAPTVQKAIGATYVNAMGGWRTSNFAVPVPHGEWAKHGHGQEEENARKAVEDGEIYYQIDVNVNADEDHWNRIMFFHAYGDLGMILGLISRNAGFRLGEKGLKYPDGANPPIDLSESFSDILPFIGLSMERWREGFKTKLAIFEWVASSRFFDPSDFRSRGEGIRKVKADRKMYAEFVEWVEAKKKAMGSIEGATSDNVLVTKEEALATFGKTEVYAEIVHTRTQRERMKKVWCGSNVSQWAGMGEYWKGVKLIMDTVRARLGGDEGILCIIDNKGPKEVIAVVQEIRDELFEAVRGEDGERQFILRCSSPKLDGEKTLNSIDNVAEFLYCTTLTDAAI